MKHFLKKLKSKKRARIKELLDVFAQKLVDIYEDYQVELDGYAEKAYNISGFNYAEAIIEEDHVISVNEIEETDMEDVMKKLVDSVGCVHVFQGIIVVDQRESKKYKEDAEFFRLLTEAETRDDIEYISWMFPTKMKDPDVCEYVEIVDTVLR